jgi:SAM-dependent methyltransferase
VALDIAFGLYRKRVSLLRQWGVLDSSPSILDVGCGVGQYASVTSGCYLGLDLNRQYVEYARRRDQHPRLHEFCSADVASLASESRRFDIVLMVDFLHHLDDLTCDRLLAVAARLSRRHVISLEPIREQPNRVGRWIIQHDRGRHMRSQAEYQMLFARSPLTVERCDELRLGPIDTRAVIAAIPTDRQPPVDESQTMEMSR